MGDLTPLQQAVVMYARAKAEKDRADAVKRERRK